MVAWHPIQTSEAFMLPHPDNPCSPSTRAEHAVCQGKPVTAAGLLGALHGPVVSKTEHFWLLSKCRVEEMVESTF
jgi:hypothetical protein